MSVWVIRAEAEGDEDAIVDVVAAAFADMPFADGTEAELVGKLREDGDLALSLVAVEGGAIVGHIGFSPVTIDGRQGRWLQLAPLSVAPGRQRQGIGSALVEYAIAHMRDVGEDGIGVLGDPAYYERFGFRRFEGLGTEGPHGEYFRWLALRGSAPQGTVRFARAFG